MLFLPALVATILSITATAAARLCNGHEEYCSELYSNVTQVGSHDSAFVGFLPTQNQHISVAEQLDYGIRFLQSQTHKKDNALQMCHSSCDLEDAGTVVDFLKTVKTFLDGHSDEVVTVLLTNGDRVDVDMFDDALSQADLKNYLFTPETGSGVLPIGDWPTLGELIDSGKRLVFFLDYNADPTRFPSILDEFSYFWETPFENTDDNFPTCTIDRGAPPEGKMYIMNHFLAVDVFGILIPDVLKAGRTNAVSGDGSVGAQAGVCLGLHGRVPRVVLLDYVDMGDSLGAERMLNGL